MVLHVLPTRRNAPSCRLARVTETQVRLVASAAVHPHPFRSDIHRNLRFRFRLRFRGFSRKVRSRRCTSLLSSLRSLIRDQFFFFFRLVNIHLLGKPCQHANTFDSGLRGSSPLFFVIGGPPRGHLQLITGLSWNSFPHHRPHIRKTPTWHASYQGNTHKLPPRPTAHSPGQQAANTSPATPNNPFHNLQNNPQGPHRTHHQEPGRCDAVCGSIRQVLTYGCREKPTANTPPTYSSYGATDHSYLQSNGFRFFTLKKKRSSEARSRKTFYQPRKLSTSDSSASPSPPW